MNLTTLIPLLVKILPAALQAIQFVAAESGKPFDVAVTDVVNHLTPGQPNAPALDFQAPKG
jgi:hypothetical protein